MTDVAWLSRRQISPLADAAGVDRPDGQTGNSMYDAFTFKSAFSPRRSPDPVKPSVDSYTMLVKITDLPHDLPYDANARTPNVDRKKYKEIGESLMGADGSVVPFHQKNKGITILAESALKDEENLHVTIPEGYGVTDGGHTLQLCYDVIANPDLPDDSYVWVTVRAGVPESWVPEISGGLNTALQVRDESLFNLAGKFDWLKTVLSTESYADDIAWRENADGRVDVREIISTINMFNIDQWPTDADEHPIESYSSKGRALQRFADASEQYERLNGVIPEVLRLHDMVRYESGSPWNAAGGKFRALALTDIRHRGEYDAVYSGAKSTERLTAAAAMPITASFRVLLTVEDGEVVWAGGFERVEKAFAENIVQLIELVHDQFKDLGRNPNRLGKSKPAWAQCFQTVEIWSLRNPA
jgi:hypothetical protein